MQIVAIASRTEIVLGKLEGLVICVQLNGGDAENMRWHLLFTCLRKAAMAGECGTYFFDVVLVAISLCGQVLISPPHCC